LTTLALLSAQQASQRPVEPWLFDDGSLDDHAAAQFRRFFPNTQIVSQSQIAATLDAVLPESRYPFLRRLRLSYIHLRKLTDIHTLGAGWRVVLASDVFFFRRPTQLLELVDRRAWFHMQDCTCSYGAPVETLSALAGAPV